MGFILLEAGYEDDHRVEHLLEHPQELAGSPRDLIKAVSAGILRMVDEDVGKEVPYLDFISLPKEQQEATIQVRSAAFQKACMELGGDPNAVDTWKHAWRDPEMLVPALVGVLVGAGWKVLPATRVHSWPRRFCE